MVNTTCRSDRNGLLSGLRRSPSFFIFRFQTELNRSMKKVAGIKSILTQPFGRPRLSLTVYFIAWKLILLLIALTSPGPGYDTSTALISELIDETKNSTSLFEAIAGKLSSKLVRWDAIYFTQIAQRGYVFEQEWAFGWGFTRLLGFVGRGMIVFSKCTMLYMYLSNRNHICRSLRPQLG